MVSVGEGEGGRGGGAFFYISLVFYVLGAYSIKQLFHLRFFDKRLLCQLGVNIQCALVE